MFTWTELVEQRPDLTEPGLRLLYPAYAGVGLAYLATVRLDSGPRVHPMCPIVNERGLFALIVPGPKRDDLLRDGRYAVHSFPTAENEDGFYMTGRATRVSDERTRASIVHQFLAERRSLQIEESDISGHLLFAFSIDMAMLTRTTGHGDPHPEHLIWRLDVGGSSQP